MIGGKKPMEILYEIQKPNKNLKWITTNHDIAQFAVQIGYLIKIKSIKNRIKKFYFQIV